MRFSAIDQYLNDLNLVAAAKKEGRKVPSSNAISAYAKEKYGVDFAPSSVRDQLRAAAAGKLKLSSTAWNGISASKINAKLTIESLISGVAPKKAPTTVEQKKTGDDSSELTVRSGERITTVEQALAKGGVDLTIWDVDHFIVNSWEVGAKGPDNKICVTPLWQVKVWLKAKKGWNPTEFKKILLDDIRLLAPHTPAIAYPASTSPLLSLLSLFDAHFGKLGWKPESGQDYDLHICRDRYMGAGIDLVQRSAAFGVERFLYVVGQDFFHTDQGRHGMTTSGTPQDCDGRWQKAFRIGVGCATDLALAAADIAPVDILVVPGNHDAEKSFCMGEVLGGRFHNNANIRVINDPSVFAYYRWGKCLLGFVHGDTINSQAKRQQLPATMATDRPQDWADTFSRDWYLGHFHSELEERWFERRAESIREVGVRICPSLSSSDAWHRHNNYKSMLAAEAHLYHKEKGRYGYLVHQVDG